MDLLKGGSERCQQGLSEEEVMKQFTESLSSMEKDPNMSVSGRTDQVGPAWRTRRHTKYLGIPYLGRHRHAQCGGRRCYVSALVHAASEATTHRNAGLDNLGRHIFAH